MSLAYMQKRIAEINEEKGWYEGSATVGDHLALIHSEISEALEEFRSGRSCSEIYFNGDKPEGFAVELADAVIRILDVFERHMPGLSVEDVLLLKIAYNATRPYRHGGKVL